MIMKRIAITLGDPAGIGPEVAVRALSSPDLPACIPVVIGDRPVVEEALRITKAALLVKPVKSVADAVHRPETLWLLDACILSAFKKNVPDAANGAACAAYIRTAAGLALRREVDAIVTAPISKEALRLAAMPWPGHTEMLAGLTGAQDYAMMLVGGPLRVVLATIHVALRDVAGLITKERVLKTIRLGQKAGAMLGIREPRIAVAGLNPHAGEAGTFGREEADAIAPGIEAARQEGIDAEGPVPPDTVFFRAYRGAVDIVIAMYHDQGLCPLKMIAFETGVNVTVGLPVIRTSPDHGTAYDIAWKGIANPSSMLEAIRLALHLKI